MEKNLDRLSNGRGTYQHECLENKAGNCLLCAPSSAKLVNAMIIIIIITGCKFHESYNLNFAFTYMHHITIDDKKNFRF